MHIRFDLKLAFVFSEVEMDEANVFHLLEKERWFQGKRIFAPIGKPEITVLIIFINDVEATYRP